MHLEVFDRTYLDGGLGGASEPGPLAFSRRIISLMRVIATETSRTSAMALGHMGRQAAVIRGDQRSRASYIRTLGYDLQTMRVEFERDSARKHALHLSY